jgi:carotenoid cleavage dioxygenase-like enzyme
VAAMRRDYARLAIWMPLWWLCHNRLNLHAWAGARTADRIAVARSGTVNKWRWFQVSRAAVWPSINGCEQKNRVRVKKNRVRLKTDCVMVALSKEVNRYFSALKTSNVWNFMA